MSRITIRRNALRGMLLTGHHEAFLNGEWLPCYLDSDPRVIDGAVLVSDLDLTSKSRCAGAWAEDDGTISLVVSDTRSFTIRKKVIVNRTRLRFVYRINTNCKDLDGETYEFVTFTEAEASARMADVMHRIFVGTDWTHSYSLVNDPAAEAA